MPGMTRERLEEIRAGIRQCQKARTAARAAWSALYLVEEHIPDLIAALEEAWAERGELVDLIMGLVAQGAGRGNNEEGWYLDAYSISAWEEGIDFLVKEGLVKHTKRTRYDWVDVS